MAEAVPAPFPGSGIEPVPLSRRLQRRIDMGLEYEITEIVAGAGFGKTTILEYVASKGKTVIARLRPGSQPVLDLLRAICEAAVEFAPGAKATVNDAYANAHFHDDAIGALAIWWNTHLTGAEHRIALDDLHLLEEHVGAWELIEKLIEHSKGRVSWILASRAPLQLPTSIWIAGSRMGMPITADDLAFTEEDVAELATAYGVHIGLEERHRIVERTLGWPMVTAHLVRIWNQRHDDATAIEQARTRGIDAVVVPLWSRLSEIEREMLLVSSLLDTAWPSMLRDIGFKNADVTLASLPARGVPISRDRAGAYRVHDLLREYLFEHEREALEVQGRRAIDGLLEAEDAVDALAIATRLSAHDRIPAILAGNPQPFLDPDDPTLIERSLAVLPARTRNSHPGAVAVAAARAFRNGNIDRAITLYTRALESAEGSLRATAARRLGAIEANRGNWNRVHELCDIGEASVGTEDFSERAEIAGLRAFAFANQGEHDNARGVIDTALRFVAQSDDARLRARTFQRAGLVAYYADRQAEAQEAATEAAWIAESESAQDVVLRAQLLLCAIAQVKGEASYVAAFHAEQAVLAAARCADRPSMRLALTVLLCIAAEEGDLDRASHLRERLRTLGATASVRGAFQSALALAIIEALNGRYAAATTILEHISEGDMQPAEIAERDAFLSIVYALGDDDQAASDSAQEALRLVRRLRTNINPTGRRSLELATVCSAAVSLRLGRRYEAARALASLRRSKLDSVRSLARAVSSIARGLRVQQDTQRELAAYHKLIVRLFRSGSLSATVLTAAEKRVISLIGEGNTSKEIAAYLGRSTSTVDNHIFSIMSKLKARNRLEAVMIARERNLLD